MQHTFGRQAIPMVWDFAEVVITATAPGNWKSGYELIADVIEASVHHSVGQVQPADAADHPLPDQVANVWFTDPPYYDAVPYADLSDFFLVWLKRILSGHVLLCDPFELRQHTFAQASGGGAMRKGEGCNWNAKGQTVL